MSNNMQFEDITFEQLETPKGIQAFLDFDPYKLSIVQHEASYGGSVGMYEIGVFKNKKLVEMPGVTRDGDTVKGYLTEDDVMCVIRKMQLLHLASNKEPSNDS